MCEKQRRCHLQKEKHGIDGEEMHSYGVEDKHDMDGEEKDGALLEDAYLRGDDLSSFTFREQEWFCGDCVH